MTPMDWANFAMVIWPMVEKLIVLIEGLIQTPKAGTSKKGVVMSAVQAATGGKMSEPDFKAVSMVIDGKVGEYNVKGWPNA